MTRFRRDDLVDLGDGWLRLPEPGEELFRFLVWDRTSPWMEERRLAELELLAPIESIVVPGPRPADAPDPRQLELPITIADLKCPADGCNQHRDHAGYCGSIEGCDECGVTNRLSVCFGCDRDFCDAHVLEHGDGQCPYAES